VRCGLRRDVARCRPPGVREVEQVRRHSRRCMRAVCASTPALCASVFSAGRQKRVRMRRSSGTRMCARARSVQRCRRQQRVKCGGSAVLQARLPADDRELRYRRETTSSHARCAAQPGGESATQLQHRHMLEGVRRTHACSSPSGIPFSPNRRYVQKAEMFSAAAPRAAVEMDARRLESPNMERE